MNFFWGLLLSFFSVLVSAQTQNPFDLIFQAHQQAQTYEQWVNSPYHPDDFLPKAIQKLDSEPARLQFCQQLLAVSEENYVVILAPLMTIEKRLSLSCVQEFLEKAQNYMALKEEKLLWNTGLNQSISPLGLRSPMMEPIVETLGPSHEIFLDTTDGPTLYAGDAQNKQIILTFDDGPHSVLTLKLLEILKNENLQVHFFSQGKNIKENPVIYNRMDVEGHSLGNHSWNHPNMKKLSYTKSVQQIELTFTEALNQVGYYQNFFRYPYGNRTPQLNDYLKRQHVASFLWNMDTRDWAPEHRDPELLLEYSLKQVRQMQHGIILFHDVQPQTIAMMPAFLRALKAMDFTPLIYRSDRLSR